MIYVGIDWSEKHHDLMVMDEHGAALANKRVAEGIEGVAQLHQTVAPGCWLSLHFLVFHRLEMETRRPLEDPVVRDKREAEAKRGRGDPTVGVMLPLTKGMSYKLAGDTQCDIGADKIRAGMDYLRAGNGASRRSRRTLPQPRRRAP
ncbi:hypothetical protein BH23ACT12_BH23ACT12_02750 [soil metagenome]